MFVACTLEGCANATLNNLQVTVAAPFLNGTNGTGVVTGAWSENINNPGPVATPTTSTTAKPTPSGKSNGAMTVRSGFWSGLLLTLGAFILI
jgi:hypothetical protein